MSGFEFLDLVIGLIFIYLIYSIAASTLWEIFVNASHLKGNMMRKWILANFGDCKDKESGNHLILDHPLITLFHYPIIRGNFSTWFRKKDPGKPDKKISKPTYISSKTFTDVLIDIITSDPKNPGAVEINLYTFKEKLKKTEYLPPRIKTVFLAYINDASDNFQKVKDKISAWYEEAQDRLIGSYKKNLQMWIFLISAILVGGTNADTFNFVNFLYNNDNAREAIAVRATQIVEDSAFVGSVARIDTAAINAASGRDSTAMMQHLDHQIKKLEALYSELKQNEIPIGWNRNQLTSWIRNGGNECFWYLKKITGLLITILAVALGSPFWFDVLSKLSNLRSSGSKPVTSTEKNPKDETKN